MEHSAWHEPIKAQLPDHYFNKINQFLDQVYASGTIYPPRDKVFAAIQATELKKCQGSYIRSGPQSRTCSGTGLIVFSSELGGSSAISSKHLKRIEG